jgi:hypothetical protein
MVHSFFSAIIAFSSPAIIRDKDASFNYLTNIKVFSVAFLAFMLISAKAIDRFFAVLSAFAKSLI